MMENDKKCEVSQEKCSFSVTSEEVKNLQTVNAFINHALNKLNFSTYAKQYLQNVNYHLQEETKRLNKIAPRTFNNN